MNNTAILGDCLEVMKDIRDNSVDMILCDLPYGTTACKWDTIIPFEHLWEQYKRIIKINGAIVLTASQPFTSALVMSNPKMFKYEWIWVKNTATGIAQAKYQPMKYSESVLVFGKSKSYFNPQKIERTEESKKRLKYEVINGGGGKHISLDRKKVKYNADLKNPSNVIFFNTEPNSKGKLHPTQKPVTLFEYLIKTYTNDGETVLDNCAGSFTTAIACINTNRKYICIEKETEYYELGVNRIENHIKEKRARDSQLNVF